MDNSCNFLCIALSDKCLWHPLKSWGIKVIKLNYTVKKGNFFLICQNAMQRHTEL